MAARGAVQNAGFGLRELYVSIVTMNIWEELQTPFFILAPMDDVTDTVFRRIIADTAAPDLLFTEFVNVDALQSAGRAATLPRLKFTDKERPIIAQIWGLNPENFYKSAKDIADMGYDGVDLNFGCPDKNVVRNGACSAFILPENRSRAGEIIQAAREGLEAAARLSQRGAAQGESEERNESYKVYDAVSTAASQRSDVPRSTPRVSGSARKQGSTVQKPGPLPLSVKTRLGFKEIDMTWFEFLFDQKLNALSIHGRTKVQLSEVPADWDKIGEVRKLRDSLSPATKIIGNGDVLSRQQGLALAEKHGLDGIMIGRGIFQDPFVFAANSPWQTMEPQAKIALFKKHVQLFYEEWGQTKNSAILKKFAKVYISGFDGSKELRARIMEAKTYGQILKAITSG